MIRYNYTVKWGIRMFDDITIKFKENDLLINIRNGKVILYNKEKKRHVKLSEEVYKYIRVAEKNKWKVKELIDYFKKYEDKKYIESILKIMLNNEIIDGNIFEKKKFKDIHLSLTNRCNLSCKHCVSSCSPKEEDYMDTNQILKLIDNLCDLNVRRLVLTGGEPLVRADFFEIVDYIRKTLPLEELSLSTNGTLINGSNIDFIVGKFDKVDISVDGVDEETCSQIRGKGVFEKVVKVVCELQNKNFYDISLSMVFGEKNYKMSEKFRQLNEKLNTKAIERYFVPSGRGLINREIYSDEDSILPLVIPKVRESEMKCREKNISSFSSCACNACFEQIFIDHKGNIYPCPSLTEDEYRIGSAFDKKVINSLKRNDLKESQGFNNFNKLYPFNFEKCKDCDVNIFCLKCPARVKVVKNNDKELNRWCSLTKKNMQLAIWGGEV